MTLGLSSARFRREALEHFADISIQRFRIPVGVGGEIFGSQASPEQLLGTAVEDVDHQIAYRLVGRRRCRLAKSARIAQTPTPSAPTPANAPSAAKTVVQGLRLFLVVDVVAG